MKSTAIVVASGLVATASASHGSPIGKIISMLGDLEQKVIAAGDASQKAYEEVSEFCSDRQKEMSFEVKTGSSNEEDLKAVIDKAAADIGELDAAIADLAASSAKSDKELKEAVALRTKEGADFVGAEKDLVDTVDTLERASGIISREMNKGSFAQLSGVQGLTTALNVMVQAHGINSADDSKLTALLQSYSKSEESNDSEDQDEEAGAPAAAAFENQSGGILDLLTDLQGKAEDELASARDSEAKAQHNFDLKKQALTDELKFAAADLDESKKSKASNQEKKAAAEGDLASTSKDLGQDQKTLRELHRHCMSKAADFEAETGTRAEELKALATAKKLIKEATGASLAQVSFIQVAQGSSRSQSAGKQAVKTVRDLAAAEKSAPLARLASRMEGLLQRRGGSPFGKIKAMIGSMITKLEDEAGASANEKAFCDKALSENNQKKDDATALIETLGVKQEQAVSASEQLKAEVTTLQSELAKLASSQMQMTHLRFEENAAFKSSSAELEKGLTGIKAALKVLRDYYASKPDSGSQGAAGGIVGLIEVCETDFTRGLAEANAVESEAQTSYDAETKDNALTKVMKDKDVEFKTKEIASLAKAGTELKSDRNAVQDELDAILLSLKSLENQCIAKAESYDSKVSRQKREIEGLKAALVTLGDASLIQRTSNLRHTQPHRS